MQESTWYNLNLLANELSTPQRRVRSSQVAAYLLEKSIEELIPKKKVANAEAEIFPGFNPDLYSNSMQYIGTLKSAGVVAIGTAMDSETFNMVKELAEIHGETIGHLSLRRKELGEDGEPVVDHFPVFSETTISLIGKYTFEAGFGIEEKHVEEAEGFIFSRGEFEGLTEKERGLNVMRLTFNAAHNDLSETYSLTAFIPLIGGAVAEVRSTISDGKKTRTYNLLSDEDLS